MTRRMSNAPVYYALAQARFSPVAAMERYAPDVQESLRRDGYTEWEEGQLTQLKFSSHPRNEPELVHTRLWRMNREDQQAGFVLTQTALTFHTTHYGTHTEFLPELARGLRAVHDAASLSHVSRVGLRYLNAVLPKPRERVEDYLVQGVHGISFSGERRQTLHESVYGTRTQPLIEQGTLVARVYRATGPLGFPADLGPPPGLVLMERFARTEPVDHAVLDIDHYVEGKMPLDFDALREQMSNLHEVLREAFEAMITDHARDTWR